MIPIELFWISLILLFGVIGAARGLQKEVGASAILAISLFALWLAWDKASRMIVSLLRRGPFSSFSTAEIAAIYFTIGIIFVAFISYEGVVLLFPVTFKGFLKNIFGFLGGLLNGYLIVGTIWDLLAHANYFHSHISVVDLPCSHFHNTIIQFLPLTLMVRFSPLPMLFLGLLLLLAIVFK